MHRRVGEGSRLRTSVPRNHFPLVETAGEPLLLAGVPSHRDVYLTDEEHAANDQITPCCSRALSPSLTLDL